jgi:3-deoxy-D-manno-octulosonic-acid transferase
LPNARVRITGNVKFDAPVTDKGNAVLLDGRFQFSTQNRPLIICASTHDGEEAILLRALAELRATHKDLQPRIIFAPRHPERFATVARLLEASGLRCVRRSAARAATDSECDIVLLDSIGELAGIYSLANVVFVGGSLIRHGGHNILEPAAASRAIVTGAHTANFAEIVRAFLDAGALIQLPHANTEAETVHALAQTFAELLIDVDANRRLGTRAAEVCDANRGATKRTVALLDSMLGNTAEPAASCDLPLSHADQTPLPETVVR